MSVEIIEKGHWEGGDKFFVTLRVSDPEALRTYQFGEDIEKVYVESIPGATAEVKGAISAIAEEMGYESIVLSVDVTEKDKVKAEEKEKDEVKEEEKEKDPSPSAKEEQEKEGSS